MTKQRAYTIQAREAALLLGKQIQLKRKQRRWSEQNIAERADISRATLQKIEQGKMTCAIGLVFEVASLVGVNLFEADRFSLTMQIEQTSDKIALLPKRIRPETRVADDDF